MMTNENSGRATIFYDGTSNRKHRVELSLGERLEMVEDGALLASWPYEDIRRMDDGPAALRLRAVSDLPLAQLIVEDEGLAEALRQRCPFLDKENTGVQTWKIVGWSMAAAFSVVMMTLYGVPIAADRLAPLVPPAFEKRLGQAVDGQVRAIIGGEICANAGGQQAFAKMVAKLNEAGGGGADLDPTVLSSKIPNAITLPGGKIYLLDALLQRANNPDELAGVIAHEIGHVHHRDNLRTLIQTGGTSFLFGLLFGDFTGGGAAIFVSRSLLDASHSREAEAAADDFAVDALTKLGRPATALGEFLVRMTGADDRTTILDSHPASAERLERIKKGASVNSGAAILTEEEWDALKQVCQTSG